MRPIANKFSSGLIVLVLIMVSLLLGVGSFYSSKASAAYLGTRFLELSDNNAGANSVTYNTSFDIATVGTIGSIEIEFCSNSTFISDPCTAPAGLDATGATLAGQSGVTGFSISGASTANNIILTRTAAAAGTVTADYVFKNMKNPSSEGSYFVRLTTYPTEDASGAPTDHAGIAFAINPGVGVSITIPPYLLFCVGVTISGTDCSTTTGDFVDLGDFSSSATSSGQSQMVVATNGKSGYSISANGTTLESGINSIPAVQPSAPAIPGISQFGINLRANSKPVIGANVTGPGHGDPTFNYDQSNIYYYKDGDTIATATAPEDLRKYTVSYIVDVNSSQPVGIYASTYTYVALANF
jgi:hypothetical protein